MNNRIKRPPIYIQILPIIACCLWSSVFVGIKIGLKYVQPFQYAGMRFILAGLMIFPFCGNPREYFREVTRNFRFICLVSFLQNVLLYGLLYKGMSILTGALGSIFAGSTPVFVAVISHLVQPDDKITLRRLFGIMLGMFGVIFISIGREPWTTSGMQDLIGIVLVVLSNISAGFGDIVVSRKKTDINPMVLTSSQIFLGGVSLFLFSLIVEDAPTFRYPREFYLSLFWLAFVSAVSFSIWLSLLRKHYFKVSQLNIWKFILPVLGSVLSWIILPEEYPELVIVFGMLIVTAAIIILNLPGKRGRAYGNRLEK